MPGKDLEAARFFLDLRPRGSGEEKFVCAGTAAELVVGLLSQHDRMYGTGRAVDPFRT